MFARLFCLTAAAAMILWGGLPAPGQTPLFSSALPGSPESYARPDWPTLYSVNPRAAAYWMARSRWEQEMASRRKHPTIEQVREWGAQRAPSASLTDFSSEGNLCWSPQVWQSPLADDAARLDALCQGYWKDETASVEEVVTVVDRMLAVLKADLSNWRPMPYAQTKGRLLRVRNWAMKGFQ